MLVPFHSVYRHRHQHLSFGRQSLHMVVGRLRTSTTASCGHPQRPALLWHCALRARPPIRSSGPSPGTVSWAGSRNCRWDVSPSTRPACPSSIERYQDPHRPHVVGLLCEGMSEPALDARPIGPGAALCRTIAARACTAVTTRCLAETSREALRPFDSQHRAHL